MLLSLEPSLDCLYRLLFLLDLRHTIFTRRSMYNLRIMIMLFAIRNNLCLFLLQLGTLAIPNQFNSIRGWNNSKLCFIRHVNNFISDFYLLLRYQTSWFQPQIWLVCQGTLPLASLGWFLFILDVQSCVRSLMSVMKVLGVSGISVVMGKYH